MSELSARPLARAVEILRHYVEHPHATDSLEGIAAWRLFDDAGPKRLAETEEAVEWLVSRGLLHKRVGGAAPPLYRFNMTNIASAEDLLARWAGDE